MSRLTGSDALGLFEAYQAVYNPQELTEDQVWEGVENWVNSLIEEGYDLSDYTWEEMYEDYISEAPQGDIGVRLGRGLMGSLRDLPAGLQGQLTGKDNAALQRQRQRGQNLGTLLTTGRLPNQSTPTARPRGSEVNPPSAADARKDEADTRRNSEPTRPRGSEANPPSAAAAKKDEADPRRNSAPAAPSPRPAASSPRPTASKPTPTASKPTPTASKPTPTASAQTGDKAKDMDTWAKANPKLAAASAEIDRTRGTSATTNPLMKKTFGADYVSKMSAPKTPSPTTSSTAFSKTAPSLGSSTPEVKSAGASSGSAGFGKSAPSIGSSAFKPSPASAAPTPTPTTAAATKPATGSKKPGSIVSGFDMFDVVMGHLLDEGYADTEQAALAIMKNMSEEWREDILDEGFKKMNRRKIEKQAQRLGGDRSTVLRSLANTMDTPEWRKHSTSQARKNRAGGSGSEYRKGKELQARDDAKADIKKYGLR